MKVICIFLVLLAVFQGSQSRAPKFTEKVSVRTPFFRRQRIIHSPLIVGGTPTTIAAHPHHLGLLDLIFGGYICGASNISPIWALSAAHCLEFGHSPNVVSFQWRIILRVKNAWGLILIQINLWGGSTSRLTGGHIFIVESYTLHPQYDDISLDNDVAVLRVNVSHESWNKRILNVLIPIRMERVSKTICMFNLSCYLETALLLAAMFACLVHR